MTVDQWDDAWFAYYDAHDQWEENGSQGEPPSEPVWDNSGGHGGGPPPPPPHP